MAVADKPTALPLAELRRAIFEAVTGVDPLRGFEGTDDGPARDAEDGKHAQPHQAAQEDETPAARRATTKPEKREAQAVQVNTAKATLPTTSTPRSTTTLEAPAQGTETTQTLGLPTKFGKPPLSRSGRTARVPSGPSPAPPFPDKEYREALWGKASGVVVEPELGGVDALSNIPEAIRDALRSGDIKNARTALLEFVGKVTAPDATNEAAFALAWCHVKLGADRAAFDCAAEISSRGTSLDWVWDKRVRALGVLNKFNSMSSEERGGPIPSDIENELMLLSSRRLGNGKIDFELSRYLFTLTNFHFFHQIKHVHSVSMRKIEEFCATHGINPEVARKMKSEEAQFEIVDPVFARECTLDIEDLIGNAILGCPRVVKPPAAVPGYSIDGRDFVDAVLYINLAHRKDRRDIVDEHLKALFAPEKVERVDAVRVSERPRWGSASSHIKALERAEDESSWNAVLICEDDVDFGDLTGEVLGRHLGVALAAAAHDAPRGQWDVLMLGGFFAHLEEVACCPNIKRTRFATSSHCYLISRRCFRKLRDQFARGIAVDLQNDLIWCELQNRGHWYVLDPVPAGQRESWSDMTHQSVSMSGPTSGLDSEREPWTMKMRTGGLHCFNRAGSWAGRQVS